MHRSDKTARRNVDAMRDAYGIRRALPRDVEKLPAIEAAAALRFLETGHPEIAEAPPRSLEQLALAAEQGRLWVAALDGEPVGFALAIAVDGGAHLEEMDVLPEHGRRGLGAKLLATVCDWAASRGAAELTLTTYDDVEWNRAFYERLGFEVVETDRMSPGLAKRMLEETRDGLNEGRVAMSRKVTASGGGRK